MSKGRLSKVMKFELRYLDGCGDFGEMQKELWSLQRQTREILNKTIQIAFHWDYISRENFEKTGEYLDVLKETGYKRLDGYIYNCLKDQYSDFSTTNLNSSIQAAWKKYASSKKEVIRGEMSLPSYKRDQPLIIHNKNTRLTLEDDGTVAAFTLFSSKYKKARELTSNVRFAVRLNDGTQKSIMDNILNGEYGVGECKLIYDRPKWFLLLTYNFAPQQNELDPERILGVDIGECNFIYASSFGEYGRLRIEGGEITDYAKKLEARKRALQKQAAYCGEGRVGHGTKTRVADVYKAKEKIANYRDTKNHIYSKALVDYAVKNRFGTIQMEDLSGIKEDTGFPKLLRHWTYYDLQAKIETKAKERGIKVVKINPRYTSQRCSKCGNIDKANRPKQEQFRCTKCGFNENADYNASQNISIKDIDKIIEKEISANRKQT